MTQDQNDFRGAIDKESGFCSICGEYLIYFPNGEKTLEYCPNCRRIVVREQRKK